MNSNSMQYLEHPSEDFLSGYQEFCRVEERRFAHLLCEQLGNQRSLPPGIAGVDTDFVTCNVFDIV
jgi:hypothetical protein